MSTKHLSEYLWVSKYFDAQLESYLLEDSRRRERAETTISLGQICSDGQKVMPYGELIKGGWLTITGTVTDALTDGEVILSAQMDNFGSQPL